MHANDMKNYKYGDIEINLKPGEEEVKVKIAKVIEQKPTDPVTISVGMTDAEFSDVLDANERVNEDPEEFDNPEEQIGNK